MKMGKKIYQNFHSDISHRHKVVPNKGLFKENMKLEFKTLALYRHLQIYLHPAHYSHYLPFQ